MWRTVDDERDSKRTLTDVCLFVCLLYLFVPGEAVTPEGFRFSPMLGVIAVGCVASVASVACVVAAAVAVHRKRSRRRRRRRARSADGSKTAVDGGNGTADNGGARTTDAVGVADGGAGDGTPAGGVGAGGGTDRCYHHADAADDGLDKNPDIIPHDNGKGAPSPSRRFLNARNGSFRRTSRGQGLAHRA